MKRSLLLFALLAGCLSISNASTESDPKLFPINVFGPDAPEPGSVQSGFIDSSGKIVIALTPDYIVVQPDLGQPCFAEGLQPVVVGLKTKWPANSSGYLDRTGKFAIEPQFMNAQPFSEGLAAAGAMSGPPWGDGYIDHTGKWVIQPRFENAGPFSEGLAQVTTADTHLTGFIDPKGNWVIKPQFPAWSYSGNFSDGVACVPEKVEATKSDPVPKYFAWKFIDKTGAKVINRTFAEASGFHEGLAAVKDGDDCCYIDKMGKPAFPARFSWANEFSEGLARVELKGGGEAFINKQGAVAFETPGILHAEPFSEGLAAVWVYASVGKSPNGAFHGFIDKTGKIVIAPTFLGTSSFHNGLAQVVDKDNSGYVDKTGAYVWKTKAPDLKGWDDNGR